MRYHLKLLATIKQGLRASAMLFLYSLAGLLLFFPVQTFAGTNNGLVYHGRIVSPDGSAVNSGSASFTLQIYGKSSRYWDGAALQTGNTRCLLYQESHSKNMANTLGAFELIIGEGTGAVWGIGAGASDQKVSKLFVNNPLDTGNYIKAVSCTLGNSFYFPSGPDATAPEWVDRELVVSINVNGTAFTLSPVVIKAQPYAMQAQQVGGLSPQNLFRIDGSSNLKFSVFQHDFLANSVSRDGSNVMRIFGLPAVPVSATEATSKAYVDATVASSISGAGAVGSVTGVAPVQSSGGASPAISMSQASGTIPGYLAAADWVTFNNKLGAATVFSGEVSGTYNTTIIMPGVVTTAKISDANVTFAKIQNITGPALVGRGAVGAGVAGEISVGTGLSLSVGGVLSSTNAGTVTNVAAAAPIQSSGGATPTISISQASNTIPGYLSAADWVTFNNKLGATSIFAGDVSGPYNSNVINPAAVTYAKIQNVATGFMLGRSTAGPGSAEEISVGSGLTIAGGVLSTSGAGLVNTVTGVAPVQSSGGATPAISMSQASNTIPGYLAAADWVTFNNKLGTGSIFAGDVSGPYNANVINPGAVTTAKLSDTAVTFAKIQDLSGPAIVGRGAAGPGVASEISVGTGLSLSAGGVLTTTGSGLVTTVTGVAPVQSSGGASPAISMSQADGSIPGFLAAADWTTFNNKMNTNAVFAGDVSGTYNNNFIIANAVTTSKISDANVTTAKISDAAVTYAKLQNVTTGFMLGRSTAGAGSAEEISVGSGLSFAGGVLTTSGAGLVNSVTGTGPVSSSGGANPAISISLANATTHGYISAADWVIFNNKVSSLTGAGLVSIGSPGLTPSVQISLGYQKLAGRFSAGSGLAEEISIGNGLNLSAGGVLTMSGAGVVATVNGSGPVSVTAGSNPVISISQGNATTHGYISSADWVIFNNKIGAITGVGSISVVMGATPSIMISDASTSVSGALTSTDWNIFNNKLSNVTASGLVSVTGGNAVSISMANQTIAGRFTAGSGAAEAISIGSGLSLSGGGVLTASGSANAYVNGGNAFGVNASIGTTDNRPLSILTNNTPAISISQNGRVGIGTSSPNALMHLSSASTTPNGTTEIMRLTGTYDGLDSGPLLRFTNITALGGTNPSVGEYNLAGISGYDDGNNWGGGLRFQTAAATGGGGNLSTKMVIRSSGNVGIGTTNPSVLFEVSGSAIDTGVIQVNDIGSARLRLNDTSDTSGLGSIFFAGNGTDRVSLSGRNDAITGATFRIATAGSDRVHVISNGNMGIGAFNPSYPLDVFGTIQSQGTAAAAGTLRLSEQNTNAGNNFIALQAAANLSSDTTFVWPSNGGTLNQVLTTNGAGVLSWAANGAGSVTAQAVSDVGGWLNGGNSFAGGTTTIGNNTNHALNIEVNNLPAMTISQNGYVGIGTVDPTAHLEVAGALKLSTTSTSAYQTPAGTWVQSKIVIPNFDPGAFGQIVAMGLPSTADPTARGITFLDARTGVHQPTIAVLSPDENSIMGFSFDGSNSTGFLKTTSTGLGLVVNSTTQAMRIDGSGNIGIGATNPSYPLDVRGTIQSAGTAAAAGTLRLSEQSTNAGNNFVAFRAAANLSSDTTFVWPSNGGTLNQVLTTDGTGVLSWANPAASGVTSVTGAGPISSSGGATPSISISQATNTVSGFLTNTDWVTFNNKIGALTGAGPISVAMGATPAISISQSSATISGFLSSQDWVTFNSKVSSVAAGHSIISIGGTSLNPSVNISFASGNLIGRSSAGAGTAEVISVGSGLNLAGGVLTTTNSGTVTSVTGAGPITSSGGANPSISISLADQTTGGYLSAANWVTFNDKLGAVSVFAGDVSGTYNANFIVANAVTTNKISDAQVTPAKMLASGTQKIFGRYTAGAGPGEEISIGAGITLSGAGVLTAPAIAVTSASISNAGGYVQGGNAFGANAVLGTQDNKPLSFITNNLPAMSISQSGDVGIGTTSPEARLHVIGTTIVAPQVLVVADEKPSGTHAGACTSGSYQTRTLNTVRTNTITGASLASNQITLPAGTYEIEATAPAVTAGSHKAKLRNDTDSSDLVIGTNQYNDPTAGYASGESKVIGRFNLAATKTISLMHRFTTCGFAVDMGAAASFGDVEVYSFVKIIRVQ